MTTIAVARKGTKVAIGADSLLKVGYMDVHSAYRVDDSKIIKIGGSHLALTGFAGLNLAVRQFFACIEGPPRLDSAQEIFETFTLLHRYLKDNLFLNPHAEDDDPFENSHIGCLVANNQGIFGVTSMRSVIEYSKFYAEGTGHRYALGAMRTAYDSAGSAGEIVRRGLEAAADFDEDTGEPLEVFEIERAGARGRANPVSRWDPDPP